MNIDNQVETGGRNKRFLPQYYCRDRQSILMYSHYMSLIFFFVWGTGRIHGERRLHNKPFHFVIDQQKSHVTMYIHVLKCMFGSWMICMNIKVTYTDLLDSLWPEESSLAIVCCMLKSQIYYNKIQPFVHFAFTPQTKAHRLEADQTILFVLLFSQHQSLTVFTSAQTRSTKQPNPSESV